MSGALQDHYGIAERGKLHALDGDHERAMACYRLAMRLTGAEPGLALCRRHYADCTVESLERMGALDDAARVCETVIEHYRGHPPAGELQQRDLAAALERLGCLELKRGRPAAARERLGEADDRARRHGGPLPLTAQLLAHLRSGRHVTAAYVAEAQARHGYYCVRRDQVDPGRAVEVPDAVLVAAAGAPTAGRSPAAAGAPAGRHRAPPPHPRPSR